MDGRVDGGAMNGKYFIEELIENLYLPLLSIQ